MVDREVALMNLIQTFLWRDLIEKGANDLARIAGALERAYPPVDPKRLEISKKRGPGDIIRYGDNDKTWLKEEFMTQIRERGLGPNQEQEALTELMALAGSEELE